MVRLLEKVQFKRCLLVSQWRPNLPTWAVSLAWLGTSEETRARRKLCILPSHSCYIYGTSRSKEVGEFKVIVWREAERWELQSQRWISVSFGVKRVPWQALHNIPSWDSLGKMKVWISFLLGFSFIYIIDYFINLQMTTEWEFAFLNTAIKIFCLIYSLNIPHSNQNPSSFCWLLSSLASHLATFRQIVR